MAENSFDVNPYPLSLLTEEQQVVYGEWKELFEIYNNPPPKDIEIGTVIMPTGDWLDRVKPALGAFKQYARTQSIPPHLVITGKWSRPEMPSGGASAEKVARVMRLFGGIADKTLKDRIIVEGVSEHAKAQAQNVYALKEHDKIKDPWVIVVSSYHLPRLVGSFVKNILKEEGVPSKTRLYTIPVDLPWTKEVPREARGVRWKQIFSEMEKIRVYQEKGDVATKEEMLEYTNWLRGTE